MRHLLLLTSITLLATNLLQTATADEPTTDPRTTKTEWRDDVANLQVVERINDAYARIPFSQEAEGALDDCPLQLRWSVGPNLPFPWKGGVAGRIGEDIVLAGGIWMPDRANLAFVYNIKSRRFAPLPPPPFETAYTQGACDGTSMYIVGGRAAGRHVAKLSRDQAGEWKWSELPSLPEAEGAGRWVGTAAVVPGKWLFLIAGHPTGTPFETRKADSLPDYRLRLDREDAEWEAMAPYPGSRRSLMPGAVARGQLYVFGGSIPDPDMREVYLGLIKEFGLTNGPYKGCHDYRDAFRYDPETNRWQRLRNIPFPMAGGVALTLKDRYILLMGSQHINLPTRVGKTLVTRNLKMETDGEKTTPQEKTIPFWTGYDDRILCYDVELDNYSRVGVMLYGVFTSAWVTDGHHVYGLGGEPFHSFNSNTENVLQIGTIEWRAGE